MQKIHNVVTLYGKVQTFLTDDVDLPMLQTLESLYIEARYPGELGLLPSGRPTQDDAQEFHDFAFKVFGNVMKCLS